MFTTSLVRIVSFVALCPFPITAAAASVPHAEFPDLTLIGLGGEFGGAVGLSNDTLLIGASYDDTAGADVGAVHVIRNSAAGWQQEAKLLPPNATAFIQFGYSVAIDGDVAVIGAFHDDEAAINSGAAFVYRRTGTTNPTWTLEAKLVPPDGQAWDEFGTAVAISNDTIVVGAPKDDDVAANAGSARVYRHIGEAWVSQAKLLPPGGHAADQFGSAVAVAGEVVFVGAWGDDTLGASAGAAHVFRNGQQGWTHEAKLLASDGSKVDQFGWSIAADQDDVIVGAPVAGTTTFAPGAAYVFRNDGGGWLQQAKLVATDNSNNSNFGVSVAIDGDTALVGRSWKFAAPEFRSAHLFTRSGTTWTEPFKLLPVNSAESVAFGEAVALDGILIAVGDPGKSEVSIFDLSISNPPIPGDVNGDGCVNAADLGMVMAAFAIASSDADLDGDGIVGGGDLAIVLAGWGGGC